MSWETAIVHGPIFGIALTVGVYSAARYLFERTRFPLLHPVLVSILVIIAFLEVTDISYDDYMRGGSIITFFLGPAVVALGLPMYEELRSLRDNAISVGVSIVFASAVGVVSSVVPAALLGGDPTLLATLAPKSVTTPIAMDISGSMGGIPSLTASVVVLTGVFGAVFGPVVLRLVGIVEGVAFGTAMGSASHGIGTARAVEFGATEGAASSLALCLNGIVTSLLAPVIVDVLLKLSF